MKQSNELIKEIREAYAKELGYKSFASMAMEVNIVPCDISEIAKRYATAVNTALQAKYEGALREAKETINWMWQHMKEPDGQTLLRVDEFNRPANALHVIDEALSGEGEKEVRPEHNVSIGGWITYCPDCGFPVDECNCIDKET